MLQLIKVSAGNSPRYYIKRYLLHPKPNKISNVWPLCWSQDFFVVYLTDFYVETVVFISWNKKNGCYLFLFIMLEKDPVCILSLQHLQLVIKC